MEYKLFIVMLCVRSWNSTQELGLELGQASKQDTIFMKKVHIAICFYINVCLEPTCLVSSSSCLHAVAIHVFITV